jgi:hypothetical protein
MHFGAEPLDSAQKARLAAFLGVMRYLNPMPLCLVQAGAPLADADFAQQRQRHEICCCVPAHRGWHPARAAL